MPVREEIPAQFTDELSLPPWPGDQLRNKHLDQRIEQCEAVLEQCNKDRQSVEEASWRDEDDDN